MFYWIVRFILSIGALIFYRVRVSGAENIPEKGAFILCSNHIHSWDPAFLAMNTQRQLRFMAKKELFERPIKGKFFKAMGAFPVHRDAADMASYRSSMKALAEGMGLVIFCQGTRMKELNISGAKGGVALFAVKGQVPIVPAGISGSYRFFTPIHVSFGESVTLEEYYDSRLKTEQIEEIMEGIMERVEKLIV